MSTSKNVLNRFVFREFRTNRNLKKKLLFFLQKVESKKLTKTKMKKLMLIIMLTISTIKTIKLIKLFL